MVLDVVNRTEVPHRRDGPLDHRRDFEFHRVPSLRLNGPERPPQPLPPERPPPEPLPPERAPKQPQVAQPTAPASLSPPGLPYPACPGVPTPNTHFSSET